MVCWWPVAVVLLVNLAEHMPFAESRDPRLQELGGDDETRYDSYRGNHQCPRVCVMLICNEPSRCVLSI